mmetsp:Transcript_95433/g.273721  ORF Transcript_95433/g.273721 Transcript_95433/m.273721 type:complete len:200 (-) Transcript_95433:879-1478(-)
MSRPIGAPTEVLRFPDCCSPPPKAPEARPNDLGFTDDTDAGVAGSGKSSGSRPHCPQNLLSDRVTAREMATPERKSADFLESAFSNPFSSTSILKRASSILLAPSRSRSSPFFRAFNKLRLHFFRSRLTILYLWISQSKDPNVEKEAASICQRVALPQYASQPLKPQIASLLSSCTGKPSSWPALFWTRKRYSSLKPTR